MVLPSHIPPLAWGRVGALWAGAFFFAGAGNTFFRKNFDFLLHFRRDLRYIG